MPHSRRLRAGETEKPTCDRRQEESEHQAPQCDRGFTRRVPARGPRASIDTRTQSQGTYRKATKESRHDSKDRRGFVAEPQCALLSPYDLKPECGETRRHHQREYEAPTDVGTRRKGHLDSRCGCRNLLHVIR